MGGRGEGGEAMSALLAIYSLSVGLGAPLALGLQGCTVTRKVGEKLGWDIGHECENTALHNWKEQGPGWST